MSNELDELIERLRTATVELREKRTVARHIQDDVLRAQQRVDTLQEELDRSVARLVDPSTVVSHAGTSSSG